MIFYTVRELLSHKEGLACIKGPLHQRHLNLSGTQLQI